MSRTKMILMKSKRNAAFETEMVKINGVSNKRYSVDVFEKSGNKLNCILYLMPDGNWSELRDIDADTFKEISDSIIATEARENNPIKYEFNPSDLD